VTLRRVQESKPSTPLTPPYPTATPCPATAVFRVLAGDALASGQHTQAHSSAWNTLAFRRSHGDPALWSADDFEHYLDLPRTGGVR
jgi:hypothetical protein